MSETEWDAIDWNDYPLWRDETDYARTLVVARRHPAADDGNPGTDDQPLRTIQTAVERVQPGQRVRIHGGVYREMIEPVRGGDGPMAMIAIEAAPGERVVVSGSRRLRTVWSRPRYWDAPYVDGPLTASASQRVWLATLPESLFAPDYQPFALANVEPAEEALMPWMEPVSGTPPYTLKRGLLFQDGRRLTQLNHPGDVPRVPGSFWVDVDGRSLHVHPFDHRHPDRVAWEVAVQSHLLRPKAVGLDYIRVAGITFQHCANGFLRASTGAVTIRGGAYWILENNHVHQVNGSGLEFGDLAFEYRDPDPLNAERHHGAGHVIVRRNRIADCGTAGMRSLHVTEGRVLENVVRRCGWQDGEYYFECAGIKLLVNRHTLVAGNVLEEMAGACGIWMDWDNRGARVTRNLIRDVESQQGAIFIEASPTPNLIDRNVIWNIDGDGVFCGESSRQLFLHNLIGRVTGKGFKLIRHSDRLWKGEPFTCEKNRVRHNILVDPLGQEVTFDDNDMDGNLYIWTKGRPTMDLPAWQGRGFDRNPRELRGAIGIESHGARLWWDLDGDPVDPAPPSAPRPDGATMTRAEPEANPEAWPEAKAGDGWLPVAGVVTADFFDQPWPHDAPAYGPLPLTGAGGEWFLYLTAGSTS